MFGHFFIKWKKNLCSFFYIHISFFPSLQYLSLFIMKKQYATIRESTFSLNISNNITICWQKKKTHLIIKKLNVLPAHTHRRTYRARRQRKRLRSNHFLAKFDIRCTCWLFYRPCNEWRISALNAKRQCQLYWYDFNEALGTMIMSLCIVLDVHRKYQKYEIWFEEQYSIDNGHYYLDKSKPKIEQI